MNDYAILVEGLGKRYVISHRRTGGYKTFRETVTGLLQRKSRQEDLEDFWAIRDLCFEIRQGDVVGVLGRNGAGKSTLLKLLSRITRQTTGTIRFRGRVSSLLEVGTGFHPELSGRENIFLNGAIMGMSRRDITRRFDDIVAFAEIERFLDTPVKRYSSGMYMRLAFAVAAHLEPDVLLVDEVLAVGDLTFQRKCLGKMQDVATKEGRTVLFVSHNMHAIARLCPTALWLKAGQLAAMGPTSEVVRQYQAANGTSSMAWSTGQNNNTSDRVSLESVWIAQSELDKPAEGTLKADHPFTICIRYRIPQRVSGLALAFRVTNSDGIPVFSSSDHDDPHNLPNRDKGLYEAHATIPAHFLAPGRYVLLVAAHVPFQVTHALADDCLTFDVGVDGSLVSIDNRLGVMAPQLCWQTRRVETTHSTLAATLQP